MIPVTDRPHYVYRCFDAAGRLLYVGCTFDPFKRYREHMLQDNFWWVGRYLQRHMARFEVERNTYPDKASGVAAEKAAIQAESPLLNITHNTKANQARAIQLRDAQPSPFAERWAS